MNLPRHLLPVPIFFLAWAPLKASENEKHHILATGNGVEIHRETVEAVAQKDLANLELERLRFEAQQKKKHHEILEKKMQELVADRVLELESLEREKTKKELFDEVNAAVAEPTREEIEKVYASNRNRFKEPKDKVLPQIERLLKQQKSKQAFVEYVEQLTEKYGVEYHLEPLRFDVEEGDSPFRGPPGAPVTIIEFSDFQCPYCSQIGPKLKQVTDEFEGKVRLVFRQFPLTRIHQFAQEASEASLCAADQGKFWEMHDAMFSDYKNLSVPQLKEKATELGLDEVLFAECLDSNRYATKVQSDIRDGMTAGVTGTPAFFINGIPFSGAIEYEKIVEYVRAELETVSESRMAEHQSTEP